MIFLLNLEKAVFKLTQNLTLKLLFNAFQFSGKAVSSCAWRHSHHCVCSVLWMFYLLCLMFLVYLSQWLHSPFFGVCLELRRLFLGEYCWIVHATLYYIYGAGWLLMFNARCQYFFLWFAKISTTAWTIQLVQSRMTIRK